MKNDTAIYELWQAMQDNDDDWRACPICGELSLSTTCSNNDCADALVLLAAPEYLGYQGDAR